VQNASQLLEACREGKVEEVAKLLDAGVNIESRDVDGWTALIKAAGEGQLAVVQLLLKVSTNKRVNEGVAK
jgi:ankyrin repeat protein